MSDNKRTLVAGVAALVAGSLVAETWHENYWKKAAIEGPSAPTDHVPEGGGERGLVVRVSNANATGNVTAHMVSWPELLTPGSLRRAESPFTQPNSFDYTILAAVRKS